MIRAPQLVQGQGADELGRGGKAAGRGQWDLIRDTGLQALLWSQQRREGRGESGWWDVAALRMVRNPAPWAGFLLGSASACSRFSAKELVNN